MRGLHGLLWMLSACTGEPPAPGPAPGQGAMDCPDGMLAVPGGPFLMGAASDEAGEDEQPLHEVRLDGFCLDRTEVRADLYGAWLEREGRKPEHPDATNPSVTGTVMGGSLPASGVSLAEAQGYCASRGARLPTEAEWEKAARGGCELAGDPNACESDDARIYPWGQTAPDCARAHHRQMQGGRPTLCGDGPLPVDQGAAGAGPYGHLHLAGNVWERVADAWHPGAYGDGALRVNPAGGPGTARVLRGGGWNTFSTNMRVSNRFHDLVMGSAPGFRCAWGNAETVPDAVAPIRWRTVSGTVSGAGLASGRLSGRALYVTAFAAQEDPKAPPRPGASPGAEVRLVPKGLAEQSFALQVPGAGPWQISAALDDGSAQGGAPASGSGGVGQVDGALRVEEDVSGVRVILHPMGRPGGERRR